MSHNHDTVSRAANEKTSREDPIISNFENSDEPPSPELHEVHEQWRLFDSWSEQPPRRGKQQSRFVRAIWYSTLGLFLLGNLLVWAWVIISVPHDALPATGIALLVVSALLAGLYGWLIDRRSEH